MDPGVSNALLDRRWAAVRDVVTAAGGDPDRDLWRDGLKIYVRVRSLPRRGADGQSRQDEYVFLLEYKDYDDHAARIFLCDPNDPSKAGQGKQFYPLIEGNNVFAHDSFLCMPGDRRCYEQGNHVKEWNSKEHFHPEIVVGSLFALIRHPQYRRPLADLT